MSLLSEVLNDVSGIKALLPDTEAVVKSAEATAVTLRNDFMAQGSIVAKAESTFGSFGEFADAVEKLTSDPVIVDGAATAGLTPELTIAKTFLAGVEDVANDIADFKASRSVPIAPPGTVVSVAPPPNAAVAPPPPGTTTTTIVSPAPTTVESTTSADPTDAIDLTPAVDESEPPS